MYPKLCGSACYYLYNIRRIRKFLSREHTEQLVHAFITSRLDHCNRPLYSVLDCQIMKLQRVINANARLIYCARKFCHITPIRIELHRLPVRRRIKFKILLTDQKYCGFFHFYDKSMKLCHIITNPKTNISGYGAKPNSTLDTSVAQAPKLAYMKTRLLVEILLKYHF